jgi:ABC-type uncharacterized transport system substrate-binding protein
LVASQQDIIVTSTTAASVALQRATQTIPIVFANVSDPVASGIVARLNRPGGNITGFANYEATLGGKWLELLSEIAPGLKRATIMFNPNTAPASAYIRSAAAWFFFGSQAKNISYSTYRQPGFSGSQTKKISYSTDHRQ